MGKQLLSNFVRGAQASLKKRSPEILIGMGIAGMVTTTILAVKATPKAVELINDRKEELEVDTLTPIETVKATWKCYIPAAVSGVASIACIIGSNSVNSRRNAALATAYTLSESAFTKYRDSVVETIGEKKEKAIRDKVSEKELKETPVNRTEVITVGGGKTLFFDPMSHRYFYSTIDKIKKAENNLNWKINTDPFDYGVTLNDFYEEIGLPTTATGDALGWNIRIGMLDIYTSAQKVEDDNDHEGEPCLVINFANPPKYEFL